MTFWQQWLSYCNAPIDGDQEERKLDRMQPIAIGNERLRDKKGSMMVKPN
jgi:hypothetical protein